MSIQENNQSKIDQSLSAKEHQWIDMPDGIRLAARIWWPKGPGPFPAILETIPYRKRDLVRARDERNHACFAAHGYVSLRVDMRGSGDSEGHMPDMYSDAELADSRQVIHWIAKQKWCSGCVGMFGTSWGGTASLQTAVDAPTPLKAVIANCATIDRFEDDIHWNGGTLLTDSFEWGATLPAILAAPPDAATVGDGWQDQWKERLKQLSYPLEAWIQHQTRGAYWRHGSVRFNSERLSCPVLAVGGWSDRYSNSVMKLVQSRPDICWGIVGPWGHHFPDQGEPGPAVSFQALALEWWDHWLKGKVSDTRSWPRLRLWRRKFDPPRNRLNVRNGNWIETTEHKLSEDSTLFLCAEGLASHAPGEIQSVTIANNLHHGQCAGDTGYFGRTGGLPLDQSKDDSCSLCFDSAPLKEDLDLIGHAQLSCDIIRDLAEAQLVCRLCEVTPDGRSNLVVWQIRNLALDEALDSMAPFTAGKPVHYCIHMPSTAYRFARGNRIRLAIGTSYWPLVWPVVGPASIQILTGKSCLRLPRINAPKVLSKPFPENTPPVRQSWAMESAGPLHRGLTESTEGRVDSYWQLPRMTFRYPDISLTISIQTSANYLIETIESHSQMCTIHHTIDISRPDGTAQISSSLCAAANHDGLTVESALSVYWNQKSMAEKVWRISTSSLVGDSKSP